MLPIINYNLPIKLFFLSLVPRSQSRENQSVVKKKLSRTGKRRYQFDEEEPDEEATQIVTPKFKGSQATPSTSGVSKTKKAPSRRSDSSVRQGAPTDDTVIMPQSSGTQNRKLNLNHKINKMTRNKKQFDQEDVTETQSKFKRTNRKTKRKGQAEDDGHVSDCKFRRQKTMGEDSQDIETVFFTEGNVGNIKVEADEDEKLTDVEANADSVNVEQITNNKNQKIRKTEKVTRDQGVQRGESEQEENVNKDDRRRKISDDTVDDFLDAILGNDRVEKRKAPPPKRKPNTPQPPAKNDNRKDESRKLRRKDEKEEIFDSVFMTEKKSTQKDFSSQDSSIFSNSDLDDIYNDPTKWKKNKRSPRAVGFATTTDSINTMIMDDNDKYEQLFKTGKMKKKTK